MGLIKYNYRAFRGEAGMTLAATTPAAAIAVRDTGSGQLPARHVEGVRAAVADAFSPHTRRAYSSQWQAWQTWANGEGVAAIPAAAEHVAAYLVARGETGAAPATLRAAASAIAAAHRAAGTESPTEQLLVRSTLRGLSRQAADAGHQQTQARPLDGPALAAIRATALLPRRSRGGTLESREAAEIRGRVDIALAGVLSDAGLRRSEAANLTWADIAEEADDSGRVTIRRSKTDALGHGAVVAVTPTTLRALTEIRDDGADDERVFGLSASQLARRVNRMAETAGLGPGYSGHSGRVGLAARMSRRGAPDSAIMRQGRWTGPAMVARYTRSEKAAEALAYLET